ncbi:MAG: PAS domain S-box protein [Desulfobacterales bacterium]|nr:PAS domain S-box protein [Desulfobacterales bacterium]MCP4162155.1 PAS domain S-box protein [Deltaproteobacteria bacterium]
MPRPFMVKTKDSIGTQLLKWVILSYLIITSIVTSIHLSIEYFYTKERVNMELKAIGNTFAPSLGKAIWDMNMEQLQPTFLGMKKFPSVVGIKLQNERGEYIGASGMIIDQNGKVMKINSDGNSLLLNRYKGLFSYSFSIKHKRRGEEFKVGEASIYSSNKVVINRVRLSFLFIIINSIIVTFAIWILVLWFSRMKLNRPLTKLTAATEQLSMDKLDDIKIDIRSKKRDELKILEEAFNNMVQKLSSSKKIIQESEKKYRNIFEHSVEGIFQTSLDGFYINVNNSMAKFFGYESPLEMQKTVTDIAQQCYAKPNEKAESDKIINEKNQISDIERQFKRKDGTLFWGSESIRAVRNEESKLLYFEGTLIDITERKAKERAQREREKAELASQAKSDFLANMSHELRTPLNAIMGYAQILTKDKEVPESKKRSLAIIQQSSIHLLTMINDILDLSKIEAQKMDLFLTDFNLSDMLKSVSDIFRVQAKEKGISFLSEISSVATAAVTCDEQKLRQVLINLLNNAVKFTDRGKVILNVDRYKNIFVFQVEDTGIGIAPEALEEIFVPFQQADHQDLVIEGTGLGLAISRTLTQLMGGELKVLSKVGVGTIFLFELELPNTSGLIETKEDHKKCVIGYAGERIKILVVDEVDENRSLLINALEPLGFEMVEAVNGKDGVDKTIVHSPDLILMDMIMPVMQGDEAIRQIRKLPIGQKVAIISISASISDLTRKKSLDAGGDDFLGKPFILEDLFDLIEKYLELKWIYEEEDVRKEEATTVSTNLFAVITAPPKEDLIILFDLAMQGNITGILEKADKLERMDSKFTPFTTELHNLGRTFKIKKIKKFIKQYLD